MNDQSPWLLFGRVIMRIRSVGTINSQWSKTPNSGCPDKLAPVLDGNIFILRTLQTTTRLQVKVLELQNSGDWVLMVTGSPPGSPVLSVGQDQRSRGAEDQDFIRTPTLDIRSGAAPEQLRLHLGLRQVDRILPCKSPHTQVLVKTRVEAQTPSGTH